MNKMDELTYADDPNRRFLRPTEYRNVEEEIKDLALTKEEEQYSLKSIIRVRNSCDFMLICSTETQSWICSLWIQFYSQDMPGGHCLC